MNRHLYQRIIHILAAVSLTMGAVVACKTGSAKPASVADAVPTMTAVQAPTATDVVVHTATAPAPSSTSMLETKPAPTLTPTGVPTTRPAEVATGTPTALPPTPTDTHQPTGPGSGVSVIVAELQGLTLDAFFDASYRQLLLRKPEQITALGISEQFGLRNDQLNNLSDAFVRDTQELEVAILDIMRSYDRAALTSEQQLSYDIYEWYLDNRVRGHAFMYYTYPLHHFIGSYHDELLRLFTETHPMTSIQDAEDYVAKLNQVDDQVQQLLEGLQLRESAGIVPPKFVLMMTSSALRDALGAPRGDVAQIDPQELAVYTVFLDKLEAIDGIGAEETARLLDGVLVAIDTSFIPAFVKMLAFVDDQITRATDDAGVWKFPDGDAFYAYILRDQNSTDLTAEEIHELGLREIERIHGEMRRVFATLGYPQNGNLEELFARAINEAGFFDISSLSGKQRLIAAYENIIAEADERTQTAFDIRPRAKVVVLGGPDGGYYVPGSTDGSRPGAFHVATGGTWAAKMMMAPVAYHEAIPGHHTQIAIAQELDLPLFRRDLFFNGYSEGWALYAEQLAWELGLYENDVYGNLGRLRLELMRSARLVADTGIHAFGWTRQEANDFMSEAMGASPGAFSYEVDRYIVLPAQATGYKVGMLKILELRQRAMDALGEQFDLKSFHDVVLSSGGMPLDILERLVNEYIEQEVQVGTGS